jgi:hypothetical protein
MTEESEDVFFDFGRELTDGADAGVVEGIHPWQM